MAFTLGHPGRHVGRPAVHAGAGHLTLVHSAAWVVVLMMARLTGMLP